MLGVSACLHVCVDVSSHVDVDVPSHVVMMCQVSACVHVCVDVMLPCSIVLKPKP
jgi:hypothetical protein